MELLSYSSEELLDSYFETSADKENIEKVVMGNGELLDILSFKLEISINSHYLDNQESYGSGYNIQAFELELLCSMPSKHLGINSDERVYFWGILLCRKIEGSQLNLDLNYSFYQMINLLSNAEFNITSLLTETEFRQCEIYNSNIGLIPRGLSSTDPYAPNANHKWEMFTTCYVDKNYIRRYKLLEVGTFILGLGDDGIMIYNSLLDFKQNLFKNKNTFKFPSQILRLCLQEKYLSNVFIREDQMFLPHRDFDSCGKTKKAILYTKNDPRYREVCRLKKASILRSDGSVKEFSILRDFTHIKFKGMINYFCNQPIPSISPKDLVSIVGDLVYQKEDYDRVSYCNNILDRILCGMVFHPVDYIPGNFKYFHKSFRSISLKTFFELGCGCDYLPDCNVVKTRAGLFDKCNLTKNEIFAIFQEQEMFTSWLDIYQNYTDSPIPMLDVELEVELDVLCFDRRSLGLEEDYAVYGYWYKENIDGGNKYKFYSEKTEDILTRNSVLALAIPVSTKIISSYPKIDDISLKCSKFVKSLEGIFSVYDDYDLRGFNNFYKTGDTNQLNIGVEYRFDENSNFRAIIDAIMHVCKYYKYGNIRNKRSNKGKFRLENHDIGANVEAFDVFKDVKFKNSITKDRLLKKTIANIRESIHDSHKLLHYDNNFNRTSTLSMAYNWDVSAITSPRTNVFDPSILRKIEISNAIRKLSSVEGVKIEKVKVLIHLSKFITYKVFVEDKPYLNFNSIVEIK